MTYRLARNVGTTILVVLLAACGGGGAGSGGGANNGSSPAPQDQTIAFATPGLVTGAVGSSLTNAATGGGGSGAITYSSSNLTVATVNPTSGVATLNSVGSTSIVALKAASAGFNQASATYTLNVTPGTQGIAFTQAGPLQVLKGFTLTNTASGGAGTGAITYVSANTAVATVNSTSGIVAGVSAGTATITASKAADANYLSAQATYVINVQVQAPMSAWIGANDAQVTLPAIANGAQFIRTTDRNCNLGSFSVCANVQSTMLTGASVTDTTATTAATAYYSLLSGNGSTNPLPVNVNRFSERIGHTTLFFNNRYWVIGGSLQGFANAKADVWSSIDGKTWELEQASAQFGARWMHQSVVYGGKMWVFGGVAATGALVNDAWTSTDGITWTLVGNLPTFSATSSVNLRVSVFNGAMWAVFQGSAYSSTDGVSWILRSASGAIGGSAYRAYASLTVYAGKLWYIGGTVAGNAVNDVWSSADGVTWAVVNPNAVAPRQNHTAFVLNNRLWVFGGTSSIAGTAGSIGIDAWSTADGLTWIQEATATEIDQSYFGQVVQEPNKVTLVGGILRGWSNRVWQTTDGNTWNDLSPYAQFSPRITADAVSFLGDMWLIGGAVTESVDTNEIWKSSDGLNWTRVTPTTSIFSPRDSHQVVVFNNRIWVIGGWDNLTTVRGTETRLNDVWSSADGINWTLYTAAAAFSRRQAFATAVFGGRLWVIGGNTDTNTTVGDVWSTTDGVNWTQATSAAPFTTRAGHRAVAIGNAMYVIGGQTNGAGVLSDKLWMSVDGAVWNPVTPVGNFAPRAFHSLTQHNGRVWIAGGNDGTTQLNDVWSTADGLNWTSHTPAAQFSPRSSAALVSHNSELWLISGFTLRNRSNEVWRSTDGINWRVGFRQEFTTP